VALIAALSLCGSLGAATALGQDSRSGPPGVPSVAVTARSGAASSIAAPVPAAAPAPGTSRAIEAVVPASDSAAVTTASVAVPAAPPSAASEPGSAIAAPPSVASAPGTPIAALAAPEAASGVPALAVPPSVSAAPEPSGVASGTPAPSSSAEPAKPAAEAPAKIHDTVVFSLRQAHGDKSADERARAASEALERTVEVPGSDDVRVVHQGDSAVVFAGNIPIVELYPEDARASGYTTVDTQAAAVAARVRDAILAEKRRSAIASTVFSLSLAVFFALIAFYVLRKIGEFFQKARQWALDDPNRITGIKFQSQVVIGATALRSGALVTLIVGRWMAQLGVVYVWLVFALSLFNTTRPYTEKLTGLVVTPLSSLAARIAASLPLAVVAAVSGVAVYILLRFVQLFFEGVERRQTELSWLPADLAPPTSVLVRIGIVVTALVFAAPIVTGDQDGVITRTGSIALLALGIASTPLLASMIVGALVVYGRRVKVGDHAELGTRAGRVLAVGLMDVRMVDDDGCEIRVPHLASLLHPVRIQGPRPRIVVDLSVSGAASPSVAKKVLVDAASALGDRVSVELASMDAEAATYRVTLSPPLHATAGDVRLGLFEALRSAGIALGRAGRGSEPS
jgi:small-conductance mechanosensitive channel